MLVYYVDLSSCDQTIKQGKEKTCALMKFQHPRLVNA